ncbi:MAG: hypothetical protein ACC628_23635, partial [Pirellulaceae bacterium]
VEARLEELQRKEAELNEQLPKLVEDQAYREAKVKELSERHDWLASRCAELEDESKQLRQAVQSLQEHENSLKTQIAGMTEECNQRRNEVSDLHAQRDELVQSLSQLEKEMTNARIERGQLESDINHLRAEKVALEKEMEQRRIQCSELTSAAEKLNADVHALREQNNSVNVELTSVTEECRRRSNELSELKTERDKVSESLAQLDTDVDSMRRERDQLQEEVTRLKARKAGLEEEVDHCNRMVVKVDERAGKSKDRLAELWQPVLDDKEFQDLQSDDENRCLGAVQDYLRSLGLQFHERVILAFHTSLKVADISPLVVLAGISGTGKSLLPRRYAEGMGLHFLNLAVQPRWDSPQDMFGFFNYLEGRYRATELARALFQMDEHFDHKNAAWGVPKEWLSHRVCKNMLLVLLDEMNLARVEYYFSEFLSRLEIRRDVDPNNAQERRTAEIGLEVGLQRSATENGAAASPVLPLYVNTNVLFVGTMNEDETTQSLSDKVVDRANVLRFGRPRDLRVHADTNGCPRPGKRLPYETWLSWRRDHKSLDGSVAEQVDEWIGRLNNDVMSHIHRPFAHRTRLAMRTYVANYPQTDDRGVRQAMADQIEQKILPKFRGLNPNEPYVARALDTVIALSNEFKDEQLAKAISDCLAFGKSEHQFLWLGVDRSDQNR